MNQFQKSQSEKIRSCYESENLEKSEGSRGGKVIGHTKSGKPIYEPRGGYYKSTHKHLVGPSEKHYSDFTKQDHEDTSKLLRERHEAEVVKHRDKLRDKFGSDIIGKTTSQHKSSSNGHFSSNTKVLSNSEIDKIAKIAREDKDFSIAELGSGYDKNDTSNFTKNIVVYKYIDKVMGEKASDPLRHSEATNLQDSDTHLTEPSFKAYKLEKLLKTAKKEGLDTAPLEKKIKSLRE